MTSLRDWRWRVALGVYIAAAFAVGVLLELVDRK